MHNVFRLSVVLLSLCSCGSMRGQNTAKQAAVPVEEVATPMSCLIEGQVVKILPAQDADSKSVCARYPCRALVKLINVSGCGAGVSMTPGPGDTMEMRFAYTLKNTKRIFPEMKTQYPGLKKGQHFRARAAQRLRPGTQGELVIYGYSVP